MRPLSPIGPPLLSIIVPVMNEARTLPALLRCLASQQGVGFELIVCDGGSQDDTLAVLEALRSALPFHCVTCCSGAGRGRQLNAGVARARGAHLLFLHADSTFYDVHALANAYRCLRTEEEHPGDDAVAGHFGLIFEGGASAASWACFHHAWKARLHRPYCVHGDQGFMLSRAFFHKVGPFDEALPFLEDVRLAKAIRRQGRWTLLPAAIGTSVRRFEVEGFYRRQVLNALLLTCEEVGCREWLAVMPGVYRRQAQCGRLRLGPFFAAISKRLRLLSCRQQFALWRRVGRFVCDNVWQLALMVDTRRHYHQRRPIGVGRLAALEFFDRRFAPWLAKPWCWWAGASVAWLWFRWRILLKRWT